MYYSILTCFVLEPQLAFRSTQCCLWYTSERQSSTSTANPAGEKTVNSTAETGKNIGLNIIGSCHWLKVDGGVNSLIQSLLYCWKGVPANHMVYLQLYLKSFQPETTGYLYILVCDSHRIHFFRNSRLHWCLINATWNVSYYFTICMNLCKQNYNYFHIFVPALIISNDTLINLYLVASSKCSKKNKQLCFNYYYYDSTYYIIFIN